MIGIIQQTRKIKTTTRPDHLIVTPPSSTIDGVNIAPENEKIFIFNELPDISDLNNPTRSPIPSDAMFNTNVTSYRNIMLENGYYPLIHDLKENYNIKRFYYFDSSGNPSVNLFRSDTNINNWIFVATLDMANFNQWKYIEIPPEHQTWRYYKIETQASNFPTCYVPYGVAVNPPVAHTTPDIKRITTVKTFDQIAGICTFPDITPEIHSEFRFARFYVDARWLADDDTGELMVNPANFSNGMDLIQTFQNHSAQGVEIDFNMKEAPRHLDSVYTTKNRLTGEFKHDYKWLDTPSSDPTSPSSYTWYSQQAFNVAAIFGSVAVPVNNLNFVKTGQTITTGLNVVRTFSFGNEIDLFWEGVDGHFKAQEHAALLSACIDGNKGEIVNGGVKTADPNAKVGTSGTITWRPDYLNAIFKYAAGMRNETLENFLTNIEHIEIHHYSNDGGGQLGPRNNAISPFDDDLRGKIKEWREYADRYWPGVNLYLGEWGYDENPAGFPADQYAPAIIDDSNSKTKAAWMQQGYAYSYVENLDSLAWYMIRHTASGVGRYASCGFLSRTEEKLFTWYAFTAMNRSLTGFTYEKDIIFNDNRIVCFKFINGSNAVYMIFLNTSVDLKLNNITIDISGEGFNSCTEIIPMENVEDGAKANLEISANTITISEVSEMPRYISCSPNLPAAVTDVTNLYLTTITNNSINFTWTNTSISSTGIRIYRKERTGSTYIEHDDISPFLNSYNDIINISEDTIYDYSIRPYNSQGETTGNNMSVRTDISTLTLQTTYKVDFRRSTTTLPSATTYNIFDNAFETITLTDISGTTSSYQLTIVSGMTFFQDTGAVTGDNSGIVPDDVLKEHVNMPSSSNSAILELLNVPNDVKIKVKAVCSKAFASSANILLRVGENNIFFNALNNTSKFIDFPMLNATSNKITITFTRIEDNAILNSLWFEIYN